MRRPIRARPPERVFVGVGSNLGDRRALIRRALRRLAALPATRLVARAPVRATDPVGPLPQPRYLNSAVEIETGLSPAALLHHLKRIERDLGRVRTVRWGPRTIDLDILLFGRRRLRGRRLTVPHPRLARRRFALEPLADLAPDQIPPGCRRSVRQLLQALEAR
jgi:2-amino-4-hydroxy-6-hydroxymethyldihydropteridine diphosphokinase